MNRDPDPAAIQREPPNAVSCRSGITTSAGTAILQPPEVDDIVHPSGVPILRRLTVLGPGLAVGAVFALFVAGPMMPSIRIADRLLVFTSVMTGPVIGTAWGMAEFHPAISLGWLGLLLIPAHPARPCIATGCVTSFGLALWFFSGFFAMMVAAFGS
jgi:hypothetical protein